MAGRVAPYIDNTGLVFAYDQANIVRSYLGEPTTNLALFNIASSGFGTDTPSNLTQTSNNTEFTYKGRPSRKMVIGSGYWNCYIFNYNNSVSSTVFTISFKVKAADGSNPSTFIGGGYIYGTAGNFFPSPSFTAIDDGWYICYIRYSGTAMTLTSLTGVNGSGGPKTFYITDYQAEAKNHFTPFTPGNTTRSATQGLLDLTGKATIDLSNVSFDSNAQMTFDGTDDKIHGITAVHSHLSSSAIEFVVTPESTGKRMTVGGYRHNAGYSAPTIGMAYIESDNKFYASVITAAEVYRHVGSTTTITANKTYHVVLNKDTSAGTLQMYVNGVLEGTQTFNVATYAQWSSAGSYIGSDIIDLGKSFNTDSGQGWSGDFLDGNIHLFKMFSKTLTASEIQQNFNAVRGRYGI
jgi:hypothetical protein